MLQQEQTEPEYLNSIVSIILGQLRDWPRYTEPEFLQRLLQLSQYHGVEALVIEGLDASEGQEKLAPELKRELKIRLQNAASLHLARSQDLISLAKAFENSGARLLVLKGGGIASSHYSAPYLRDRCDTDIFIDLKHIRGIRDCFLELGYLGRGSVYKSHQFEFTSPRFGGKSVCYDVHWRISNRSQFSRFLTFEEVDKEAVQLEGLPGVRGLKPVHALLLACVHRAANPGHDPDRLIWIYDIHLLSQGFSTEEWSEFTDIAVSRDVQQVCLTALQKSADVFKTDVPDTVMNALTEPLQPQFFVHKFRMSQLGLIFDDFRELADLTSRLEMVCEYLFPSGEYLLERYEKSGHFWVPILYGRYLFGGFLARLTFR